VPSSFQSTKTGSGSADNLSCAPSKSWAKKWLSNISPKLSLDSKLTMHPVSEYLKNMKWEQAAQSPWYGHGRGSSVCSKWTPSSILTSLPQLAHSQTMCYNYNQGRPPTNLTHSQCHLMRDILFCDLGLDGAGGGWPSSKWYCISPTNKGMFADE